WVALYWMGFGDGATDEMASQKKMADALMKLVIGVICLSFVTIRAIQAFRSKPMAFRPVMWQSTAAGMTAGATSTFAHAAGPVTAMYLLPQRLGKNAYVATTVLYYWIGNQIKLVPYISLDLINTKTLLMGLVLVPAVPIGVVLGKTLSKRVNEKVFGGIVYTLLALTGFDMCRKALTFLMG
ncbi:MAG: TSUP family transporter, partial [Planctomycetota bacterium]